MDIEDYRERINHVLDLISEEYSDDYSDDTYSWLLSEVLEMGHELFGESWLKQIADSQVEAVINK